MKKIQLRIESVNSKTLVLYTRFILKLFYLSNIKSKIVFLPSVIKRFTFLKSPHVFKKAKEHFEIKKYKVILICNINIQKFKMFLINRPNTVRVKIMYEKRG